MKTADVYVQNSLSVYIFSGILEFFYGSMCSIVKIEIKSQLKILFYLFWFQNFKGVYNFYSKTWQIYCFEIFLGSYISQWIKYSTNKWT